MMMEMHLRPMALSTTTPPPNSSNQGMLKLIVAINVQILGVLTPLLLLCHIYEKEECTKDFL